MLKIDTDTVVLFIIGERVKKVRFLKRSFVTEISQTEICVIMKYI